MFLHIAEIFASIYASTFVSFFFSNPRRWMQIWQLSFDTAGSYCSENDPVWVVSTVSLSVQMNSSVLTSRIAATSNFITSSGSTNVQSIVNVKL